MVTVKLVRDLVDAQFPQFKDLSILPVAIGGWDNWIFHLGGNMLIRMPSAEKYAIQVEKEQKWLPILAPLLPLPIPLPVAMGAPDIDYPWQWSIYRWIEGETVATTQIINLDHLATNLASFLLALQGIEAINGPLAGPDNFYRGGALVTYDIETRQAIATLKNRIDAVAATELWENALDTKWPHPPVWVHGDVTAGNLLVQEDKLSAVIDFGGLAIGDPACDLAIAWTLFKGKSREIFRKKLSLDASTWARGRAWALWKALITAVGYCDPNNFESRQCWKVIDVILTEYKEQS